jgi:hypothetical protein
MILQASTRWLLKKALIGAFVLCSMFTLPSCGGDEPEPQPKSKLEQFSGTALKVWGIEKLYVNDTLIQLTAQQLLYSKTYKRDSSFVDSDGLQGTWNLDANGATLKENITLGGTGTLTYKVETLTESNLHLRLIGDGTQTLNTLYQFRAK